MFDECHKAKNFVPGKEAQSTKVAATVLALQQRLPKARVVYCSATGISEVGNMAYMSRLVRKQPNFKCLVLIREHACVALAGDTPGTIHWGEFSLSGSGQKCIPHSQLAPSACWNHLVTIERFAAHDWAAGCCWQGLWGPGSAFADFEAFLESMKKRGVSFLEMLSMVRAAR